MITSWSARILHAGVLGFVILATNAVAHAEVKVEEKVVAPISNEVRYFITPVDAHLIAIQRQDNAFVVTYDGENPQSFDDVLHLSGLRYAEFDRAVFGLTDDPARTIVFSDDGQHYAYAARQGDDLIILVDGQPHRRYPAATTSLRGLHFIPSQTQVYYNLRHQNAGRFTFQLVVGQQESPPLATEPQVRFSRDGRHYAYVGLRPEDHNQKFLMVDGQQASYEGQTPIFTSDGKLVTILPADTRAKRPKMTLQVDGKPVTTSANIRQVFASPQSGRWAAVLHDADSQKYMLYLDGAIVPGTQGVDEVLFSPDGNRYAAMCISPDSKRFYVVDGQVHPTQLGLIHPLFSPDSSRFVYIAIDNMAQQRVVVNGQESPPYQGLPTKPFFSPDGKRLAWVGTPPAGGASLVVDDRQYEPVKAVLRLTFSPDGSRFAWLDHLPTVGRTTLTLDDQVMEPIIYGGELMPRVAMERNELPCVLFSQDGKHTAFTGALKDNPRANGIFLDGQFIPADPPITRGTFTPDGKHLYWVNWKPPRYTIFLDGRPVGGWEHSPMIYTQIDGGKENWKVDEAGVLTCLVTADGNVKRLRITPGEETSLATLVNDVKLSQEKAQAEATAAKAEAERKAAEEQAAREQAAADARKAQEEAAAARKKPYDDAVEAKRKAREEAAAAKTRARQEALEKARRK